MTGTAYRPGERDERIAQLEEALRPFAELWERLPSWMRESAAARGRLAVDGESLTSCPARHFREAAVILKKGKV